jgi:hypothetical protein
LLRAGEGEDVEGGVEAFDAEFVAGVVEEQLEWAGHDQSPFKHTPKDTSR